MNKRNGFILIVIALAIGGAAFQYFFPRAAANSGKATRTAAAIPVLVAKAQIQDVARVLELVGRAEAYQSVTLKARVDGQVAALPLAKSQPCLSSKGKRSQRAMCWYDSIPRISTLACNRPRRIWPVTKPSSPRRSAMWIASCP